MMRSVSTKVAIAALLYHSASSFTLPSSSHTNKRFHINALYSVALPIPDKQEEDIIATTTSTSEKIPAVNTIQDLDGQPISPQYFEQKMDIPKVEYYTCPEKDAFSGFMSHACRVYLFPGKQTVFYKSIIFENLSHAKEKMKVSPYKLVRDAKSYTVVASFMNSVAAEELRTKAHVHIPKQYDSILRPDKDDPIKSKFSFLHEDFAPIDGWYQQWLLHDIVECKAALHTFAKLHAYFWYGSNFYDNEEAAQELQNAIWKSGSYVQPSAQILDGVCSTTKVSDEWLVKRQMFEEELSSLECWDNLGIRLQSVSKECGRLAHPFAYDDELNVRYQRYKTFTHGDPKQANLFFRKQPTKTDDGIDDDLELEVGLIDFQWSGFGLAATDIAHFIASGVHADRLVNGGEEMLLQYYFDELQKYLVEYGAFKNEEEAIEQFSYDTFMEQYDIAFLDICRLVIAYTWARFQGRIEKEDEEGCARTMNHTSYNKSILNVIWLVTRCDEILKSRHGV